MPHEQQPGGDETQPGELRSTGAASVAGRAPRRRVVVEVAPGDQLGGYSIERRLGAGGMGEVFAARRVITSGAGDGDGGDGGAGEGAGDGAEAPVALKVLAQAGPTALVRFKREFRALADVTHPNLITLHELTVPSEGVAYFTMELIDGLSFTDYVRGRTPLGQLPNLVRLGRALGQLIAGLHHLHLAQCLHRDVKPSNVLVTREGRVVILDFGLVSEVAGLEAGLTHDGAPLGTPAYMAPEQAIAGATSPASDYYAVGVMLYECLTGELPFRGSAIEMMLHKQDGEIPDPRERTPDVPVELRTLCMRLLARDAEARPSGTELLAILERLEFGPRKASSSSTGGSGGHGAGWAGRSLSSASLSAGELQTSSPVPFVGRKLELAQLSAALRDVEETGAAVALHVHGPGGLGKTALLGRFMTRVKRRHDALLLSGRCLERESVPYKGVDAIIDALSVQLRRMPAVELAALKPRHLGPLLRIFPVLAGVWDKPANLGPGAAAQQRGLGLAALRELLGRLSARRPVVICVDDFQWADVDSVRLLDAVMRPPRPPAMLVVLGFRAGAQQRSAAWDALAELRDAANGVGRDVRELSLGPLTEADALDLTMRLMGEAADPELAGVYVARAGANPFYLGQIVLGAAVDGSVELSLDEILARRIVALDPVARRLLAVVAVAGTPVSHGLLHELIELEPPLSLARVIDELCALGLLIRPRVVVTVETRSDASGAGLGAEGSGSKGRSADADVVELSQGQIRELVLSELELDEVRALHLRLADLLAQDPSEDGADLEAIADHYVDGGDRARAAEFTERAGQRAAHALAFARAVELYERTLELLPATAPGARRRALRLALAHELINLGRGAAASDILLELAVVAKAEEARSLRRRATEQLLRAGRVDEGIDLGRTLFEELGEPMPRGLWSAVWMILRERARLWLGRRRRPALRPEAEIPEGLLTRLDLVSSVATGLSLQELIFGQALQSRALVLAREAGEPRRLGVVLSQESVGLIAFGQVERARDMLLECRELAALADDRELDRAIDLSEAMLEWFAPRMAQARARLAELLRRLDDAPGADWIRANAAIRYAETCVMTGRLAELRREGPTWVATARERGNLHELASLLGVLATVALAYDDLEGGRRNIEVGRECWDSSRYTVPDLTLDLSAINVKVYAGDFEGAGLELERVARDMRDSGMIRIRVLRDHLDQARARSLAHAAARDPGSRVLARELERARAPGLERRDPLYRGEARILAATSCSLVEDADGARRAWRLAAMHLREHGMATQLAAVRLRLAGVTRGRESANFEALGEAYLREHAVPNRGRFLDWYAPAAGRP